MTTEAKPPVDFLVVDSSVLIRRAPLKVLFNFPLPNLD